MPFIKGVIVVICSPGKAYAAMETAWLISWQRQGVEGLLLMFLYGSETATHVQVVGVPQNPHVIRFTAPVRETLIPGVLEKTHLAMKYVKVFYPDAYIFRTNLSSHVDLKVLDRLMINQNRAIAVGISPLRNHLSGAGLGLTSEALTTLLNAWKLVPTDVIDDVAMSEAIFKTMPVVWTGRLDRVWPDGLIQHGSAPWYHVRVKGLDRVDDARILQELADEGMPRALRWFVK